MIVLVTFPRSGSSWIQKYVNEYNKINYGAKDLYDFFGKKDPRTSEEKQSFLTSELPQKYSIKYFTYHDPVGSDWWQEYHWNDTIIKLDRKDKWRSFLSYLCQSSTGWKYHNPKTLEIYSAFNTECRDLYIPECVMQEWFERLDTFFQFDKYDEVWYYENINHEWLINRLVIDQKQSFGSYNNINYEERIINLEEVKKFYVENTNARYGNNKPL